MHDSAPVLIIAGSGTTHFMGKAGMQEIFYHGHEDALNVFRPVTKGCWLIIRPDSAIEVLNTAVKVATSGRPGPVFVQLPYDIQLAEVEGEIEPPLRRGPTLGRARADQDSVRRVADMIAKAERPLLLAGGGVIRAQAADALRAAVEKLQIPVATTLPAKGQISEDHPLSLGTLGRSGWASAAEASREADLIVGVGARFSDNHTANWRKGSIYDVSQTKIVQVDVDGSEIGRNFPVELGLVSDARLFLEDLAAASRPDPKHQDWIKRSRGYRDAWLKEIEPLLHAKTAPVHPARLVYEVGEALGENGVAYIDIGDVTQYAEAYMRIRRPGAWQISPGMAEMGWAASGVAGGVAADPSRPAIVLTGDGAFNLVNQAVCTSVEYNLPAVWVILNNYEFGIERKGMERSYQRSHPWCTFTRKDTGERYNPDYVKLAHAYGAEGARIEDPELLGPDLAQGGRQPPALDHRRADRSHRRLLFHQGHRSRLSERVGEDLPVLRRPAQRRQEMMMTSEHFQGRARAVSLLLPACGDATASGSSGASRAKSEPAETTPSPGRDRFSFCRVALSPRAGRGDAPAAPRKTVHSELRLDP